MPYLVDGHNLVPKIGIRLESTDDELELIAALEDFARRERSDVEVFFDGAPPGSVRSRRLGRITAHFVRVGSTADAAIAARLESLGGSARNWTVVSSDREVQAAARGAHARRLSSEEFARRLRDAAAAALYGAQESLGEDGKLSRQEVEEWLKIFRREE